MEGPFPLASSAIGAIMITLPRCVSPGGRLRPPLWPAGGTAASAIAAPAPNRSAAVARSVARIAIIAVRKSVKAGDGGTVSARVVGNRRHHDHAAALRESGRQVDHD